MSSLRQPNGDDYPEAALKHLVDAKELLKASRYDGAGYHAGYVFECALKTLLQIGGGSFAKTHNLNYLNAQLTYLLVHNPQLAPYLPHPQHIIPYSNPPQGWNEVMRYRACGLLKAQQATDWVDKAEKVYNHTIIQLIANQFL